MALRSESASYRRSHLLCNFITFFALFDHLSFFLHSINYMKHWLNGNYTAKHTKFTEILFFFSGETKHFNTV